ncbi:extracellular solute-binding protein [Microvirga sp. W0021]|uniref:Extracellular solute-binding protein n=1 Tax=Hohaiivirga grylli TaxID=3133970 RepID=A0ABV0BHU6_9HYPH
MRVFRQLIILAFSAALLLPAQAQAQKDLLRHGLALVGEPKLPKDFKHFDYVNPQAPKVGTVRLATQGTFDSLNIVVAGVKGQVLGGIGLIYESLMTSSQDEVDAMYGQLAETVSYPDDYSGVTYTLREGAKWHDGTPITSDDVIFSFEAFKQYSPMYSSYYANVDKVIKNGQRSITFTFKEKGNRELPFIVGQLTILPKHWWEGADANGKKRDISQTTLEIPLGSGPYKLKSFETGRSAVFERVEDYWGKDLPVNVGQYNFDEIRYEYYRDATVLVEAFKADKYDFRAENIARNWSTAYNFPALEQGRVIKEEFAMRNIGIMQASVFNLRRDKFKDERVRRAFNLAFNFEETNKNLFYGLYSRINSYFFGTELASSGLPQGRELEILESLRGQVPDSVFTAPYRNPVNATADQVRENLRQALGLLKEAGYELKGRTLVSTKTGEPFKVEFLSDNASFEAYALTYKQALEKLGITVTIRTVDPAQYKNRTRNFDFDILTAENWVQTLSPGNEQRSYWGSASADEQGSRNLAGIKNPAIDTLIDKIVFAKDRDELVATTRALDRVLMANNYVMPQWSSATSRTLRWNRFGRPDKLPNYGSSGFPIIWWYDNTLAEKTGAAR